MIPTIFAAQHINQLWYALPLVVVVSLVYAATRHEPMGAILLHALRVGTMVVGFMLILFVFLLLLSWWV